MAKHHHPTQETRAKVSALYSFGITQEDIAKYLDISVDTLDRQYRRELDTAIVQSNAEVAAKLFRKATKGDDVTAQIFWLKTRGGWRNQDNIALTQSNEDLKNELRELRSKLDEKNKRDF